MLLNRVVDELRANGDLQNIADDLMDGMDFDDAIEQYLPDMADEILEQDHAYMDEIYQNIIDESNF